MYRGKIKHIKEKLIDSLQFSSELVFLNDINGAELDDGYKIFFNAVVDWWIYEDKLLRNANKSFAIKGLDDEDLNNKIDELYKTNARFDINEFDEYVERAVKLRINFLLRPRATLLWFIFGNELTKTYEEVALKLRFFPENYNIIAGIYKRFNHLGYDNKPETQLNRYEFENLIFDILKELNSEKDYTGLFESLNEISLFLNQIDGNNEFILPVEALEIYFNDVYLETFFEKIKFFLVERNLAVINENDFEEFFREFVKEDLQEISTENITNVLEVELIPDEADLIAMLPDELIDTEHHEDIENEMTEISEEDSVGEKSGVIAPLLTFVDDDLLAEELVSIDGNSDADNDSLSEVNLESLEIDKNEIVDEDSNENSVIVFDDTDDFAINTKENEIISETETENIDELNEDDIDIEALLNPPKQ